MQLTSKRLIYRDFTKNDFQLFYSVFGDEQIMRYALNNRFECEEEAKTCFEKVIQDNKTCVDRKAYEFAVFLATGNAFIGFADIEISKKNSFGGCSEIGYFLLPGFWGNGYAVEIANTLIDFCFTNFDLHRVCASCNSNNLASEKVMMKAGMTKEGELRKVRFKNGMWDNECRYSILADEWKKHNNL